MAESKPKGPAKASSKDSKYDPYSGARKATGIGPDPMMEGGKPKVIGAGHLEIPGVKRGAKYLADKIDPPLGEGGYARGAVAGGIQGLGNFLAEGVDLSNVTPAHAPAAGTMEQLVGGEAKPMATFLGWQRGLPEQGIPHVPLYNVQGVGHPLHGSTVSPQALHAHGIDVPHTPALETLNPRMRPNQPQIPSHIATPPVYDPQGMQVQPEFFNRQQAPVAPVKRQDPYQQILERFNTGEDLSAYGRIAPKPQAASKGSLKK